MSYEEGYRRGLMRGIASAVGMLGGQEVDANFPLLRMAIQADLNGVRLTGPWAPPEGTGPDPIDMAHEHAKTARAGLPCPPACVVCELVRDVSGDPVTGNAPALSGDEPHG